MVIEKAYLKEIKNHYCPERFGLTGLDCFDSLTKSCFDWIYTGRMEYGKQDPSGERFLWIL